jgi:hypothetical protein
MLQGPEELSVMGKMNHSTVLSSTSPLMKSAKERWKLLKQFWASGVNRSVFATHNKVPEHYLRGWETRAESGAQKALTPTKSGVVSGAGKWQRWRWLARWRASCTR